MIHRARWTLVAAAAVVALSAQTAAAQACLGIPGISERTRIRYAFEQSTLAHGTERALALGFARPGANGVFGAATAAARNDPGLGEHAQLFGVSIGDRLRVRGIPALSVCPRIGYRYIDGPDDYLFSGVDITETEREFALAAGLDLAASPRVQVSVFASFGLLYLQRTEEPSASSGELPYTQNQLLGEKQFGIGLLWDQRLAIRLSQASLTAGDNDAFPFASFARAPAERGVRVEVSVLLR